MRVIISFIVLLAATVSSTPVLARQVSDHPAQACITPQLSPTFRPEDGFVPVVMVHGWTSSSEMWDAPINNAIDKDITPHNRSFSQQIQRIPGSAAWVFDFNEVSARWVTDPKIGSGLAESLRCLREAYDQEVIVVGHSMGGLAARQAAAELGDDATIIIAGVVTFGTPHLGSDIAAVLGVTIDVLEPTAELLLASSLVVDIIRICGDASTVSISGCDPLPPPIAAFDSEAGQALRTSSDQLTRLPSFPADLPVRSIAGETRIVLQEAVFGIFYQDIGSATIGDFIVTSPSATAVGDPFVRECQLNIKSGYALSDDTRQLLGLHYSDNDERSITSLLSNPCFHTELTSGVELSNEAIGYTYDLIKAELDKLASDELARLFVLAASRGWNLYGLAAEAVHTGPEGGSAEIDPLIVIDEALAIIPETPNSSVHSPEHPYQVDVYPLGCDFPGDVTIECHVALVDEQGRSETYAVWMQNAAGYSQVVGVDYVGNPVTVSTPVTIRGIGGVRAGETLAYAEQHTSQRFRLDGSPFDEYNCFFVEIPGIDGIYFQMDGVSTEIESAIVAAIYVDSDAYKTPSGISVGDSRESVIDKLGSQLVASPHAYVGPNAVYLDFQPRDQDDQPYSMRFEIVGDRVVKILAGLRTHTTLVEGCV